MSEFYHPSNFTSDVIHYSKIASVDTEKDGFVISYFSPSFARGRYLIDYERFEELYGNGTFSKAEVRKARQLFKKMELINSCKDTINQILQNVIKKQALYLETGNEQSLLPLSQKELAEMIGVATSSVSRAIRGKSIDTPWGEEIPLKRLFPRPKRFRKELLKQLLETDNKLSSDEAIRAALWDKFGVAISRRSIANLRKELKFPIVSSSQKAMGAEKTK
jgi:RNA polymerase sigma-54 factor